MIRFASPSVLLWWILLPVAALVVGFVLAHRRAVLARLGSWAMVRRLAASSGLERPVVKTALVLMAAALLVLAWARPQWGRVAEPVTRRGIDVVIALDTSTSMLAADARPERMALGKAFAADLAHRLAGNRVGLVAFAGSAFPQCPLTLDTSAVQVFLDIMEVGDVPDAGSNLEEAIEVSMDAFPEDSPGRRVIVLISDGEGLQGDAVSAAARAAAAGVLVYTVGTGTPSGAPIPLTGEDGAMRGYKKDHDGRVVTTRLDRKALDAIARAGRGRFILATSTLGGSARLAEDIDRMEKADLSSRIITTFKERFQIPLLGAVLLLFIETFISPGRRITEGP
ncbi:MAG: VWA domain-containing protein [Acidobacteriota bacterium]